MTGLNRNQVVEILRLASCENLVFERKEFIFHMFVNFKPMYRFKNRNDVSIVEFW